MVSPSLSRFFACALFALGCTGTIFKPSASAPFLGLGLLLPSVARDLNGSPRTAPVDLGPFELP